MAEAMIGRDREQALLHQERRRVAEGAGRLVLLGGEAGIGKTSLALNERSLAAADGWCTLTGNCFDLTNTPPYGPWLQIVSAASRLDGDIPLPSAFASGELAVVADQHAHFEDVQRYFSLLSQKRPIFILLEDIHWADPASVSLLRHIAVRLSEAPVMILATYRVDEISRKSPLYAQLPPLVRESDAVRIELSRLPLSDLEQLAQQDRNLQPEDVRRLAAYLERHSEGNPFFATELLRTLESIGVLPSPGEKAELGELDQVVIPALLQQVIDIRVDRLGEEMRQALEYASVIGHDVPTELWRDVSELPLDRLYGIADEAIQARLLDASRAGASVHFVHALIREAIYEGLSPFRRRSIHSSAAKALINSASPDPDEVAYHLQQAGDATAVDWLVQAGERAQRAYAWLTARARFASAAELLKDVPGEEERRAWLLLRIARLQRYVGTDEGIPALIVAERLARAVGNHGLAADCIYSQGVIHFFAGEFIEGGRLHKSGVEELERVGDAASASMSSSDAWLADALPPFGKSRSEDTAAAMQALHHAGISHRRASQGWHFATSGRLQEAFAVGQSYMSAAGSFAEPGPLILSGTGHAAQGLAIAHTMNGEPAIAEEWIAETLRRYAAIDHHAVMAFTLLAHLEDIILPYYPERIAERRSLARQAAAAISSAAGAFAPGLDPMRAFVNVWLLEGRWDDAADLLATQLTDATYILRRQVTTAGARLARARGDAATVAAMAYAVLPDGPATTVHSAPFREATILQLEMAYAAMDSGDLNTSRKWLEARDIWYEATQVSLGRARTLLGWAQWHSANTEVVSAGEALAHARTFSEQAPDPLALLQSLTIGGSFALDRGDLDGAETALLAASDLAEQLAAPYELALVRVETARLANLKGDAVARNSLAHKARSVLTDLGAVVAMKRLDSLVGAIALPDRPGAQFGLTARELEVLQLLAEGLTDVAIGDRLFISHRTVGQHLRSIYGKLGVTSRSAATRFSLDNYIV